MIVLTVAGDAVARPHDAGEFLDVEMQQLPRLLTLIADDGRRRRKRRQARPMTVEKARHRSLRELRRAGDLESRQPPAAQRQHASHAQRVGDSGGTKRARRAVAQARRALCAKAGKPLESRASGDTESRGHAGDRLMEFEDTADDLRSTPRRKAGLTVQVHTAVVLGSVSISQPHLSKSSPHEQPLGTSQLAAPRSFKISSTATFARTWLCCFPRYG